MFRINSLHGQNYGFTTRGTLAHKSCVFKNLTFPKQNITLHMTKAALKVASILLAMASEKTTWRVKI